MVKKASHRTRRDRWGDWAVILLFVVALLLGGAVMVLAEGQRDTFVDSAQGLTLRYPQGWLLKSKPGLTFEAVDPTSGEFGTTYQVRIWPIDATAAPTATLAAVLNNGSLSRAQEGTAYRLFDITPGPSLDGQPTVESTYAYVVEGTNPFVQRMPVVVQGLDVAVRSGSRAFVFSLLASRDAFERAKPAFMNSVQTAVLQSAAGN